MLKYIKFFLKSILGYPIYFISGFIPRNKNIWVFGSLGVFNDNSRYLYQYVVNNPQLGIQAIWIGRKKESVLEARKYGEAHARYSFKGLYYSLIAKVYIFSVTCHDINAFTSRKAIMVNLWHGIPIKKIGFDTMKFMYFKRAFEDTSNPLRAWWVRVRYPFIYRKDDFVLSPSWYVANYSLKSAFCIETKNIILAEYPRVTYLKECEPLEEYQQYHKVLLYTPTWRDDGRDFLKQANFNFEKLNLLMQEFNAIFLIKLHYATKINIDLTMYEYIRFLPHSLDPIRLMKTADCLITDYSSIYLDYLVLDRPIVHFSFDLDEYMCKNRELYFDYDDVLAGLKVETYEQLHVVLIEILKGKDSTIVQRHMLKERFLEEVCSEETIIQSIQKNR